MYYFFTWDQTLHYFLVLPKIKFYSIYDTALPQKSSKV